MRPHNTTRERNKHHGGTAADLDYPKRPSTAPADTDVDAAHVVGAGGEASERPPTPPASPSFLPFPPLGPTDIAASITVAPSASTSPFTPLPPPVHPGPAPAPRADGGAGASLGGHAGSCPKHTHTRAHALGEKSVDN